MNKNNSNNIILIPNGTSPKNLGDQVMLLSLLSSIKKVHRESKIVLHTFDSNLQQSALKYVVSQIKPTVYSWAVFERKSIIIRIFRVLLLIWYVLYGKTANHLFQDYATADLIVFAPGGYLRSRKGFTQSLNLIMQLIPFWIAFRTGSKTLGAPMSVGPFAHQWQEWLVAKTLARVNYLFAREAISQRLLSKYGISSVLNTDMSLYQMKTYRASGKKRKGIGLIVREFGDMVQQKKLEEHVVHTLSTLSKNWNTPIQPFVHVDAPEYGDYDRQALGRIIYGLEKQGCTVLPSITLNSVNMAFKAYKQMEILITMRLHAALIALKSGVPSLVISDEYKSAGLMRQFNLESCVFTPDTADSSTFYKKAVYLLKHKTEISKEVKKKLFTVHSARKEFANILSKFIIKKIPYVTVAISAYNEELNIEGFLKSVLRQKEDGYKLKQIFVVSDGSTDKTVDRVRALKSPKITVIRSRQRKGKSAWLNMLYKKINTEYLIQSDADVIFNTPFVIRDIVQVLETSPKVGMCGGNPQPLPSQTYIETAVNSTVYPYLFLRPFVRNGRNPLSADGRLLAFRREAFKALRIPENMIANDRYAYYTMKVLGWEYAFVPTAVVRFRSPQTLADHIRQNVRFVAAPIRLRRYFPKDLIGREESISLYWKILAGMYGFLRFPFHLPVMLIINRYCEHKAKKQEAKMSALWDMAVTTKRLKTLESFI